MAQFQVSMPYLWAMLFSNAIFFAGDWAICYPVMLFHSPFQSRMTGNPGVVSKPAYERIETTDFPGFSADLDTVSSGPPTSQGIVYRPGMFKDMKSNFDFVSSEQNDPPVEFGTQKDDEVPPIVLPGKPLDQEGLSTLLKDSDDFSWLSRRRAMERLAQLSCSM